MGRDQTTTAQRINHTMAKLALVNRIAERRGVTITWRKPTAPVLFRKSGFNLGQWFVSTTTLVVAGRKTFAKTLGGALREVCRACGVVNRPQRAKNAPMPLGTSLAHRSAG